MNVTNFVFTYERPKYICTDWHNISFTDNRAEVLNERLFLLVGRYVLTNIIHDLMIHFGVLLASSGRIIFCRPLIAPVFINWEEIVRCQVRANETYSKA